jgi:hypothetical protein
MQPSNLPLLLNSLVVQGFNRDATDLGWTCPPCPTEKEAEHNRDSSVATVKESNIVILLLKTRIIILQRFSFIMKLRNLLIKLGNGVLQRSDYLLMTFLEQLYLFREHFFFLVKIRRDINMYNATVNMWKTICNFFFGANFLFWES